MPVCVDEPGQHERPGSVEDAGIRDRLRGLDRRDAPVLDDHVGALEARVRGIADQHLPAPHHEPHAPQYLRSVDTALPDWAPGTPAVLCVAGPHAIPVSSYVRAGDDRIVLALGARRDTLSRLRADPATAFCVLGEGVAFTAHCHAAVVRESLQAAAGNVAVELRVERVQDHLADGRTELLDGARWRWSDEEAAALQPRILEELRSLADSAP